MKLMPATTALGLLLIVLAPTPGAQTLSSGQLDPAGTGDGEARAPIVFEGTVVDPDGAPAEGAVVVSSAGGRAVTDRSGSYRLEAGVPIDARSVRITAAGGLGETLVASTNVDLTAGSALARVGPLELTSDGACSPSWLPTFGGEPGTNDTVRALTVFDDGSGPALYAGGGFTTAGGVAASHIATWDGASWTTLDGGIDGDVYALAVFDDGSGPALYAGGEFRIAGGVVANDIAKWDGSSWSTLGSGMLSPPLSPSVVLALTVFDDGAGPALYAGGAFTSAGGTPASYIAKWNGSSWTAVGGGMDDFVGDLAVFDDGGGPALYAGGGFTSAGGTVVNHIARWDGSNWTPLGSGMGTALLTAVDALTVFDDGGGPALYAGGFFSTAGGVPADGVARWDGTAWSAVGGGIRPQVYELAVFDDGGGPALFAGGQFFFAGNVAAQNIAKWDGSTWSPVGSGTNEEVGALAVFDDGGGPVLYAGGWFTSAGGTAGRHIAKWDGTSWDALNEGIGGVEEPYVTTLAVFDDGGGPALYAGGSFTTVGGVVVNHVARWNGTGWSALGSGIAGSASAQIISLAVLDDGTGSALYAGGSFTTAGGVAASNIARFDGTTWTALAGGVDGAVIALAVFDDGTGPALYAAGIFTTAGSVAANHVAKWNGTSWAPLGSGMDSNVRALTVFDDGSGPALYAGGNFTTAGGLPANYVAKWDGSRWTALGSGVGGFLANVVTALAGFDVGGGPELYVGGSFGSAGGVPANSIAKWNGSSWSALGSGIGGYQVAALTVFDDGAGPEIYVGGDFSTAGGVAASSIAKWDGSTWTPLGSGVTDTVLALTVFNDRTGPALHASGEFTSAPDSGDSYLAKWGCPDTNPPTITCPPGILVDDRRGNGRGEILTFAVTAADEEDPTPSLVCVPPSGSLFPRGATIVTCTATDFSGNQSTCLFTVTVRSKVRER